MPESEFKEDLLDILACPSCKADLKYDKEKKELICVECGQKYAVTDGIPDLRPK